MHPTVHKSSAHADGLAIRKWPKAHKVAGLSIHKQVSMMQPKDWRTHDKEWVQNSSSTCKLQLLDYIYASHAYMAEHTSFEFHVRLLCMHCNKVSRNKIMYCN